MARSNGAEFHFFKPSQRRVWEIGIKQEKRIKRFRKDFDL